MAKSPAGNASPRTSLRWQSKKLPALGSIEGPLRCWHSQRGGSTGACAPAFDSLVPLPRCHLRDLLEESSAKAWSSSLHPQPSSAPLGRSLRSCRPRGSPHPPEQERACSPSAPVQSHHPQPIGAGTSHLHVPSWKGQPQPSLTEGSVGDPPAPVLSWGGVCRQEAGGEVASQLCSLGRWRPWHPPLWLWVAPAHPAAPGAAARPPDTTLCFN